MSSFEDVDLYNDPTVAAIKVVNCRVGLCRLVLLDIKMGLKKNVNENRSYCPKPYYSLKHFPLITFIHVLQPMV